jgi:hypothetical protein
LSIRSEGEKLVLRRIRVPGEIEWTITRMPD